MLALVVPEGVVLVLAVLALRSSALMAHAGAFLDLYPLAVLVAGLALAWRFERSGVVLGLLVLAAAAGGLAWSATQQPRVASTMPQVAGVLVPLNLIACGFIRERGLWTRESGAQLVGLVAQAGVVFLLLTWGPLDVTLIDFHVLPAWLTAWTGLGDLPLAVHLAAAGLFAARTFLSGRPIDRGYLWASMGSLLAFSAAPVVAIPVATALFATAGLALAIAVVESSHSLAYRDGLTGLPGRRALDEALDRAGGRRRGRGPYTVAMVDIDHFKRFNDRHGHEAGDQVLRMVAGVLGKVGGGGRAYRYGGEEFAILFPRKAIDETEPYLERLRNDVEESRFTVRGSDRPKNKPRQPQKRRRARRLSVTVSIGVSARNGRDIPPADVVKAADEALYRAKRAGRNRVRGWGGDSSGRGEA